MATLCKAGGSSASFKSFCERAKNSLKPDVVNANTTRLNDNFVYLYSTEKFADMAGFEGANLFVTIVSSEQDVSFYEMPVFETFAFLCF